MLDAIGVFQSTTAEVLQGICPERCMVWGDSLIVRDKTQDELVDNMTSVLQRLECGSIDVAAQKCSFCAKVYFFRAVHQVM